MFRIFHDGIFEFHSYNTVKFPFHSAVDKYQFPHIPCLDFKLELKCILKDIDPPCLINPKSVLAALP